MTREIEEYKVILYDEQQWKRYTPEQQEECWQAWAKRATQDGHRHLVLKLTPKPDDVLLGLSETAVPYVVREEPLVKNLPEMVLVTTTVCTIREDVWRDASEGARIELTAKARAKALRQTPLHGTYIIRADGRITEVERGRRQ